jgi:hydrogenase nickel incorporation protein HypA/HybF
MHELSLASAIVNTVVEHADGRPVHVVNVRVGRLRQVVADSLEFYFGFVARNTLCELARLELVDVPATLRCGACGERWQPAIPAFRCPRCEHGGVEVLAGEELEVAWIEVDEREAQCIAPR